MSRSHGHIPQHSFAVVALTLTGGADIHFGVELIDADTEAESG